MVALTAGSAGGAIVPLSFDYEDGQLVADAPTVIHIHEVALEPVAGKVFAYASFEMIATNPVPYVDDQPQGRQLVTLGQLKDGELTPAVRLGISDERSLPHEQGVMYTYLFDGQLDYHGLRVRPNTPYDFRLRLDLEAQQMTVWCSGRGDDGWFLLAENAPLINPVTQINQVRVEQYPGAPGTRDVVVSTRPWILGERVRKHPLAKPDRVVKPGAGFKFQRMRSLWTLPGRHVTIAREPRFHHGFPDVVLAGPDHLVCVWRNGSHSGGTGGLSVAHSYDLGHTWSEPTVVSTLAADCPRVQRLKDGRLLLLTELFGDDLPVVMWDSTDGGNTWTNERWLRPAQVGGERGVVPSRVLELSDDSWLIVTSSYPGGDAWTGTEGEQLEFYRSPDQGQTWEFVSKLQPYPPHSISEATVLVLPDDRLLLYSRGNRGDAFPAIKAFSSDNGKTWDVEELPFAMTGRTCADFLPDGRVMVTFRSGIGRNALWAWIGDRFDTTPFLASGAHLNDRHSVALKDGALHIDNDGVRGQFTQYYLRQPDTHKSTIDVTVEVKVVSNQGRAAMLSVPYVGKWRLFPDRIELAHASDIGAEVTPGQFHTYRVVRDGNTATVYVDGEEAIQTDQVDATARKRDWSPTLVSPYRLAFGKLSAMRRKAPRRRATASGDDLS